MASTVIKIQAKDETKQGIDSATSSFKQFTSSIDSITGGLGSKVTNLLANPWTAVAAGIAATVKITKELWSTGLEATAGYEQLKASFGEYADEVDNMVQSIDKTTLATKDDLEGMAKSLSQYGLSMEGLESTLQTTADIATVTGKSFGTVESAVISAMNGQDKALTKLVPEWETMKETYGSTEEALKHLGEQYSKTRVQFTSGSITQTLDNMSSSWQNIKDNLGQTLVMKIQATGILDTIEEHLARIEFYTGAGSKINFSAQTTINEQAYKDALMTISALDRGGKLNSSEQKLLQEAYRIVGEYKVAHPTETGTLTPEQARFNKLKEQAPGVTYMFGGTGVTTPTGTASVFDTLRPLTAEILTKCAWGKFDQVTAEDWNYVWATISSSDELWDMWADSAFDYYDAWNLSKVQAPTTTKPGVTYMFGGTGISTTTGYGHSVGDTTVAEAIATNEEAAREIAKQAEADKAYHDAVLSTISDILSNTESFVGAIKSGDVGKAMVSGLQGVGGILGSLGTAGEAWKGTGADNWFTSLAPTLGAIAPWLGIAAGGVSLISSLIDTEGEGVMDEATRAKNVTYSGATTVNITNSFDGANIVGSDGMGELAKIIRNEMNRLAYNNQ